MSEPSKEALKSGRELFPCKLLESRSGRKDCIQLNVAQCWNCQNVVRVATLLDRFAAKERLKEFDTVWDKHHRAELGERLTTLLYKLMMEHDVAPSTLETIMKTVEKEGFVPTYEEKGLADYAGKLAERLVPKLKRNTTVAAALRWQHRCDCMEPSCEVCFPSRNGGDR